MSASKSDSAVATARPGPKLRARSTSVEREPIRWRVPNADVRLGSVQSFAQPISSSSATLLRCETEFARVGLRPVDAEQIAREAEQAADIRREVREEVAAIRVLGHAATWQTCREAVRRTTAVGMDQAADELAGVTIDDPLLPGLEHNRALMLSAGPVLRKGP